MADGYRDNLTPGKFQDNDTVELILDEVGNDGNWFYYHDPHGEHGPYWRANVTRCSDGQEFSLLCNPKMHKEMSQLHQKQGLGRGAKFQIMKYPGVGKAKEWKCSLLAAGDSPAAQAPTTAPSAPPAQRIKRGQTSVDGNVKSRGDEFVQSKAQASAMFEWATELARGLGPKGGLWENEEAYQGLISTICIHAGNKVRPSEFGAGAVAVDGVAEVDALRKQLLEMATEAALDVSETGNLLVQLHVDSPGMSYEDVLQQAVNDFEDFAKMVRARMPDPDNGMSPGEKPKDSGITDDDIPF